MHTSPQTPDPRRGAAWRWLAAFSLVALLTGCGGGDADTTASSAGNDGGNGNGSGTTADFQLIPPAVQIGVDGQTTLLAWNPPGTPTWTSSDPSVASVDADGHVTALAKGSAVITASSGVSTASSIVRVYRPGGVNRDPTSTSLIAQALAAGMITSEQALTYRMYALFGDPRLPTAYDGAPDVAPDHMLIRDIAARLGTMSAATQDLLRPFFLPPIYAQSAHAQSLGWASGPGAQARLQPYATQLRPLEINCSVAAGPTAYRKVSATTTDSKFTFNVYYFPLHGDTDPQAPLAAQIAAAAVETYDAETGLFGRFPLSDAGLPCNGGDAGIDIYLVPLNNLKLAGQTIGYGVGCQSVPSFIILNLFHPVFFSSLTPPATDSTGAVKSVVAHEFLHVLQLAMTRKASCDDTRWFDEATAEWAMDFVVPTIPRNQLAAPGLEDGLPRVGGQVRSGGFLAEYLYVDHLLPLDKGAPDGYGYASYLFFQYIARSLTPQSITRV
ncbi:MAG: Ig-like domain-containing protein, partial [Burkholderiales bacterium]